MVRLLLGRAGSGKTARITEEICGNIGRGETGQLLLVPEQDSHANERELCRAAGDKASLYVEVVTFTSLTRRILAATGGLAQVMLDEGGRLIVMQSACDTVKERLTTYKGAAAKPEFLEKLLSAVDEFIRCRVEPGELESAANALENSPTGTKLRDLSLLYGAYTALTSAGAKDPRDALTVSSGKLEKAPVFAGRSIYVNGFSGFTPQEWALLEQLALQAGSFTLSLCGDERDDDVFAATRATGAKLRAFCRRYSLSFEQELLEDQKRYKTADLAYAERALFDYAAHPFDGPCRAVRIVAAANVFSECHAAAAMIRRLTGEEGYRYRDIAVAGRNFSDYSWLISGIFEQYGIPVFMDKTEEITSKPVFLLITAALDTVTGGFEPEDLFRYLRTGLAGIPDKACDLLENYVYTWNIRGARRYIEKDWTLSPNGYSGKGAEDEALQLRRLNAIRRKTAAPLGFLREGFTGRHTVRELSACLYAFTVRINLAASVQKRADAFRKSGDERRASEYDQLYGIFCNVLDQLVLTSGDRMCTGPEFSGMVRLILSQYGVGTIPDALDSVTAGEAGRIRLHRPRCVIILGTNDGILPAPPPDGSMLSDAERELLQREFGIELAAAGAARAAEEDFIIYSLISAPSEQLIIFCPGADAAGAALRPSYLISRFRTLFPHLTAETADDNLSRTYAINPCLELAAAGINGHGCIAKAAYDALAVLPSCRERLERFRDATLRNDEPLDDKTVNHGLYGGELHFSAARAEQYAACRFAYFTRYGLKAEEWKEATFSAPETGTLVHDVLEHTARRVADEGGWAKVTPKKIAQYADERLTEFVAEWIPAQARTSRLEYYIGKLRNELRELIMRMHRELSSSDFEPACFELDFGGNDADPIRFDFGNDRRVLVSGRVDRVDAWDNDGNRYIRVVDYKTGGKKMDYTEVCNGLSIQLLLYLFALAKDGEQLPAGILYMPAAAPVVSMAKSASPEEIAAKREDSMRPSGLVLSDETVIAAMEKGITGAGHYIPVKLDKNGGIAKAGSEVASAEEFMLLKKHVTVILKRMANELRKGAVSPDPYTRGGDDNACRYCAYAAVCRFDETNGRDRLRYLPRVKKEELFERLRGGGEDGGNTVDAPTAQCH